MKLLPSPAPVAVTRYDSRGVTYARLGKLPAGAVGRLRVEPGGAIGVHEAPSRQLLLVLAGSGEVEGGGGVQRAIREGDLVVFEAGETHATRAGPDGLDLLAVEGIAPDAA